MRITAQDIREEIAMAKLYHKEDITQEVAHTRAIETKKMIERTMMRPRNIYHI